MAPDWAHLDHKVAAVEAAAGGRVGRQRRSVAPADPVLTHFEPMYKPAFTSFLTYSTVSGAASGSSCRRMGPKVVEMRIADMDGIFFGLHSQNRE